MCLTTIAGLPELIFDKWFRTFQSYCSQVGSSLSSSASAIENDNMLFMVNGSIKFNDGDGTANDTIYLGPEMHDDILTYKIRQSASLDVVVDRENLSSLTVTDIVSIPISIEKYAAQCKRLINN